MSETKRARLYAARGVRRRDGGRPAGGIRPLNTTTSPASLELESARDALQSAEQRHMRSCDRMDRAAVEDADAFAALEAAEAAVEAILARLRKQR